jgi:hypothetical protein
MIDGVVLFLVSKYAFSKRVVKHLVPRIDRTECQSCRPKVLSLFFVRTKRKTQSLLFRNQPIKTAQQPQQSVRLRADLSYRDSLLP